MTEGVCFTALIGPYASFFELSVALNFAYAASQNLRNAVTSGFQTDAKKLEQSFENKVSDIDARLEVMHDEDVSSDQKQKVRLSLTKMLEKVKGYDAAIEKDIKTIHDRVVDQIKSIYIFTAIFSLYILFLAGQESIHQLFPGKEISIVILGTMIFTPIAFFLSYTNKTIPILLSALLALILIFCSLFHIIDLYLLLAGSISNKSLVNIALAISFLPFALASIRLFMISTWISIKYYGYYLSMIIKMFMIELNINKLKQSKDFFGNYAE